MLSNSSVVFGFADNFHGMITLAQHQDRTGFSLIELLVVIVSHGVHVIDETTSYCVVREASVEISDGLRAN